jgi:signal transduction histidine kinase
LVKRALAHSGLEATISRAENQEDLLECLRLQAFDLVIMDYRLPGFTALEAWADIYIMPTPPPCIIVSGAIGEAAAVAAIQTGISDYLHKDNLKELGRVILRALRLHKAEVDRKHAASALMDSEQKLKELARHLQTSLEEERAAISREIHDEIGGSLAAIRLDLAWMKRHSQDAAMISRVESTEAMLGQALSATQRIMQNTRPAILDQGLAPSVQWLAEGHARRLGRTVDLRCQLQHGTNLIDVVRLTAYRTVQESLTNISKYAPEADVQVELSDAGGVLTVEVRDNGPGFDTHRTAKNSGFGLKGLSERAQHAGGWLDISSSVGRGSSITLTIPLTNPSENQPLPGNP